MNTKNCLKWFLLCSFCSVTSAVLAGEHSGLSFDSGELSETDLMAMFSMRPVPKTPPIVPVYIDCFDEPNEWTNLYRVTIEGAGEIAGQKLYLSGRHKLQALKVTHLPSTGHGRLCKVFDQPMDFSECNISFRFYVPEGDENSSHLDITNVLVGFWDTNDNSQWFQAKKHYGFQEMIRTTMDCDEEAGVLDWQNIRQIRINFRAKEGTTPTIVLDRLMLFRYRDPSLGKLPVVVNTFDDATDDHYDVSAYLSGRGMLGTFYIIGAHMGRSTELTLNELENMRFAGHLIANHTWSHLMPFDNLSTEEQILEITRMQKWMYLNGFGDGARILATPGNVWNYQMEKNLSPYVDSVRQTLGAGWKNMNPIYNRPRVRVSAGSPYEMIDAIEQAINTSTPVVIVYMGHVMEDYWDDLLVYLDYLEDKWIAGEVDVATVSDLLFPG